MKESEAVYTWKFPRVFWVANGTELLERMAFYGMFICLTLYLTDLVGYSDVEAGWIGALFAAFLYLAPPFCGAIADAIGFRYALALAFALGAAGYGTLGFFPAKLTSVIGLLFVLVGGAFVKAVITGTVAKTTDAQNRSRGFSIFYLMVNVGAFTGKLVAAPLRMKLGLQYINFCSSAACFLAFIIVLLLYENLDPPRKVKHISQMGREFLQVIQNGRFMALILIVSGFWAVQHQMYATMPKYVLRLVGEQAAPEWYANVNPLVVVVLVIPITHLVRRMKPVSSIGIALAIIPFSSLVMSLSSHIAHRGGRDVEFELLGTLVAVSVHPVTVAIIAGIVLQALAECFLSPRFLEYASKQAPPGQTGLYMGYSHLTSFFANLFGFGISGYLLEAWCPDPSTLDSATKLMWEKAIAGQGTMPDVYAHAHYIWFVCAGIGFAAFTALIIFKKVTEPKSTKLR